MTVGGPGRPGQFRPFTKNRSGQPSPSRSTNSTPAPIVSGVWFSGPPETGIPAGGRILLNQEDAEEEMDGDDLSIFDVEQAILTGQIVERQKDAETGEWKYVIKWQSVEGSDVFVVSKLSSTGHLVIITVYVE